MTKRFHLMRKLEFGKWESVYSSDSWILCSRYLAWHLGGIIPTDSEYEIWEGHNPAFGEGSYG